MGVIVIALLKGLNRRVTGRNMDGKWKNSWKIENMDLSPLM